MPRYEFQDGKSNKFWEITVEGDCYHVRYGKVGTDGQTSTKAFSSAEEAEKAAEKLTASKVKKGYTLVEGVATAPPPAATDTNPEREAAIAENPHDIAAWQVYGDWLQTQDDPRGEMVALGVALRQNPDKDKQKKIQSRINELMMENKPAWLGNSLNEIDNKAVLDLEWEFGFIKKIRVAFEYDYEGLIPAKLLKEFFKSSSSRFVQEIIVGVTEGMEDGDASFMGCLREITAGGKKPSLRRLTIGDFDADECEISWSSIGNVGSVYAVAPNLEYFRVHGGGIGLGKLEHAKLKTLVVETGGLTEDAVKAVAKANLPSLEFLEVWFGSDNYGAEGDVTMLKPLFEGKGYPKLTHLGLQNCEFEDDIAKQIVSSPILKQLKTLDLSMGTMIDEGAQALLDHVDALQHLDEIHIEDNFIGNDVTKQLEKALGKKLFVGSQDEYNPEDDWRYVSVSE